jgi:hypothetical protein
MRTTESSVCDAKEAHEGRDGHDVARMADCHDAGGRGPSIFVWPLLMIGVAQESAAPSLSVEWWFILIRLGSIGNVGKALNLLFWQVVESTFRRAQQLY